jgi:hypothetical protein
MIHEDVELETTHSGNRYALVIVWQIIYFSRHRDVKSSYQLKNIRTTKFSDEAGWSN